MAGNIATDGSLIDRNPVSARRGGWSVVMVDKDGAVYAALYGVLRGLRPSPFKAEFFAVMRAIEVGVPL